MSITSDSITLDSTSSLHYDWQASDTRAQSYTVDFHLNLGDAATNGWDTSNGLSLKMGDGSLGGELKVNEAYIQWGESILYSTDTSSMSDHLRVSYLMGDSQNQLEAGYYIWLGDMLIGEALGSTSTSFSGIGFSVSGAQSATLFDLSLDGIQSYAPTTTGLLNQANAFVANPYIAPEPPPALPGGMLAWTERAAVIINSNAGAINSQTFDPGSHDAHVAFTSILSTTTQIYANSGNATRNVYLDIQGGGMDARAGWYAANGGNTLTGDVHLRFSGAATGGSAASVGGSMNSTSRVNGDVYLEFSSDQLVLGSNSYFGSNGGLTSVFGTFNSNVEGDMRMVFNAGTFTHRVIGGVANGSSISIDGAIQLYFNGGTFNGEIVGGNRQGSSGSTQVEIAGGSFSKNITTGGIGGTINGSSRMTITGNDAQFTGGAAQTITAGSTGGTLEGDASITIKNIIDTSNLEGIAHFEGTLTGGSATGAKSLIFDNAQLGDSMLQASLTNFDTIELKNNSLVELSSQGGAETILLGAGSSLRVEGSLTSTLVSMGEGSSFTLTGLSGLSDSDRLIFDVTGIEQFDVIFEGGDALSDLDHIYFQKAGNLYQAKGVMGSDGSYRLIPEPSSASLSLFALVALVLRRRRKV